MAREGTSSQKVDTSPCGGASKGPYHSILDPFSYHPLTWSTIIPSEGANCTVRLLYSDLTYQTLNLLNDKTDPNGWFPCARKQNQYETVSVIIPKQVNCAECTLQFVCKTFQGSFYQCADIYVNALVSQSCKGKCKNKGICEENMCVCMKGYTGIFCEIQNDVEESEGHIGVFVCFVVLLIVASIMVAVLFYWKNPERIPLVAQELIKRLSSDGQDPAAQVRKEHIAVDFNRESSSSSI